jgi:hypothetical protein
MLYFNITLSIIFVISYCASRHKTYNGEWNGNNSQMYMTVIDYEKAYGNVKL